MSVSDLETIASGRTGCLLRAALELAADEYPGVQVATYHAIVDGWRDDLVRHYHQVVASSEGDTEAGLATLNTFFFDELGFRGNAVGYYDPRNSYINDVIDRRLGIPISLSVLYRELASALAITLHPINLPGHLMLAYDAADGRHYLDVFGGGQQLTWPECAAFLHVVFGLEDACEEELAVPLDDRAVLIRMLRNLKGLYGRTDAGRALRVQRRLVQLAPGEPLERRDLGICYLEAGQPFEARRELEDLVRRFPALAEDREIISYLSAATREAVRMN